MSWRAALALGVVGLGDVDRDEALTMARHGLSILPERRAGVGQEVEGEPGLRIRGPARQRKPEPQEPIDQPVLGRLETLPAQQIPRRIQVRDHPIQLAGPAEPLRAIGGHEPVAGIVGGVGAEPERLLTAQPMSASADRPSP